jgi:hypothetical protein
MNNTEIKKKLRKLFETYGNSGFPSSHSDEMIQDIHDDLVLFDAHIAGLISTILEKDSSYKSRLYKDEDLGKRIENALKDDMNPTELLHEYLNRYNRLVEMINLAQRLKSK